MPSDTTSDAQGGSPSVSKKDKLPSVAKRTLCENTKRDPSTVEKVTVQEVTSTDGAEHNPSAKGFPEGSPAEACGLCRSFRNQLAKARAQVYQVLLKPSSSKLLKVEFSDLSTGVSYHAWIPWSPLQSGHFGKVYGRNLLPRPRDSSQDTK